MIMIYSQQVTGFQDFVNVKYDSGEGTAEGQGTAVYSRKELLQDIQSGDLKIM